LNRKPGLWATGIALIAMPAVVVVTVAYSYLVWRDEQRLHPEG
jgi:hypothetical protein